MVTLRPVAELRRTGRRTRTPQHTWNLRQRPWNIQPCVIAPVIPGDTLTRILWQARAVTDTLVNPLTGWWLEYYWFYCKHRDLGIREELEQMVLDPSWSSAGVVRSSADVYTYHAANGIDWVQECLKRVTEVYFRNEGEAWNVATDGTTGLPLAKITGPNVFDSLVLASEVASFDVEIPVQPGESGPGSGDEYILASAVEAAQQQWYLARQMGLTDMSYEDWLRTYGISAPSREDPHRPELLRFSRQWQYPSNTIDPEDGSPSSAVSWAISERADKDRFFREPGFILGVTVCRPKVYFARQVGSTTWALDNAFRWLPAMLLDDPATSLVSISDGAGPLGLQDNDYVFDIRDLHVYGEQFVNYSMLDTDAAIDGPFVDRPADTDAAWFYPSADDLNRPFTETFANGAGALRQDGMAALAIKSATVDLSPGRNVGTV